MHGTPKYAFSHLVSLVLSISAHEEQMRFTSAWEFFFEFELHPLDYFKAMFLIHWSSTDCRLDEDLERYQSALVKYVSFGECT